MSAPFTGSSADESSPSPSVTRPFDDNDYIGYDPRLPSQRVDSERDDSLSGGYRQTESTKGGDDDSPFTAIDDMFVSQATDETQFSPLRDEILPEESRSDRIPPSPVEMEAEEGFALREWRRQNDIRLEEKEKKEKEILREIIEEADEFKAEFYKKWEVSCKNRRSTNREKEKSFLTSRDNFHVEASTSYWRAIAELIPNEVPKIETRGKKDQEKKPSIIVIQGPKPGKPTDLSRMRQILVKLKHNPPPHMKLLSPSASEPGKDSKTGNLPPATATGPDTSTSPAI